ncbi:MAG TPA: iron-sulfur cluster assembly scaffold protein [Thermodesulfobacteriota bacterium]|nr:iron-sulfur cluster assembly scaffold protein [Thermodesulfobacteriota bacterium]
MAEAPPDSPEELYRGRIMEHFRRPRNRGRLAEPDIAHEDSNPLCGDVVRLELKLADGRVTEARFEANGCAISVAAASLLTEAVTGRSLEELRRFGKDDILALLGVRLSPARLKCGLLPLKVLRGGAFGLTAWPGEEEES